MAMESRDAIIIAHGVTGDIVESYERAVTLKRLEGVRLPYASSHSWNNGEYSISNALIGRDEKEDDVYICVEWQKENDDEPKLITADYHIPKTNKVKAPDVECTSATRRSIVDAHGRLLNNKRSPRSSRKKPSLSRDYINKSMNSPRAMDGSWKGSSVELGSKSGSGTKPQEPGTPARTPRRKMGSSLKKLPTGEKQV